MQKNLPDRPTMRFDNRYIGRVVNTDDPDHQLRVQIRVYGVFTDNVPDEDLPWAEYAFPPGSRENEGFVTSVEVGDYVWVDFPFVGNTRRPRLLGSVHYCPEASPQAPHEMWLGPEALVHKRRAGEPEPADRDYYENNVYSQDGIIVEIPKKQNVNGIKIGSIIVTQRETGAAIEITPEGDITLHSEKAAFLTADQNIIILSEKGSILITSLKSDVLVSALNQINGVAGVSISLTAPEIYLNGNVHISGELTVGGGIEAVGSMHSEGSIEADGEILDGDGNTNHHSHPGL